MAMAPARRDSNHLTVITSSCPLLKMIIGGEPGIGKTCLLKKLAKCGRVVTRKKSFGGKGSSGVDLSHVVHLKTTRANKEDQITSDLFIFDPFNHQLDPILNFDFWNESHFALLVYDVTNRQSYLEVSNWVNRLYQERNSTRKEDLPPLFLVGNKSDADRRRRKVTAEEGLELKSVLHAVSWMEVSAKTGENVKELVKAVAATVEEGAYNPHPGRQPVDQSFTTRRYTRRRSLPSLTLHSTENTGKETAGECQGRGSTTSYEHRGLWPVKPAIMPSALVGSLRGDTSVHEMAHSSFSDAHVDSPDVQKLRLRENIPENLPPSDDAGKRTESMRPPRDSVISGGSETLSLTSGWSDAFLPASDFMGERTSVPRRAWSVSTAGIDQTPSDVGGVPPSPHSRLELSSALNMQSLSHGTDTSESDDDDIIVPANKFDFVERKAAEAKRRLLGANEVTKMDADDLRHSASEDISPEALWKSVAKERTLPTILQSPQDDLSPPAGIASQESKEEFTVDDEDGDEHGELGSESPRRVRRSSLEEAGKNIVFLPENDQLTEGEKAHKKSSKPSSLRRLNSVGSRIKEKLTGRNSLTSKGHSPSPDEKLAHSSARQCPLRLSESAC